MADGAVLEDISDASIPNDKLSKEETPAEVTNPTEGEQISATKETPERKTAIVTGCNAGIGKVTVLEMARKGVRVIMACRNLTAAEEVKEEIIEATNNTDIIVKKLDLSSLDSVRSFCKDVLETEAKIDYLVNNAGILGVPLGETVDGFETHIGVNHLAHFLLTLSLLELLKKAESARIVILTSKMAPRGTINLDDLHYKNRRYIPMMAYSSSKLANMLFNVELAKRLQGTNVTTYAVHPGVVDTEIYRHQKWLRVLLWPVKKIAMKTNEQGALTTLYCVFQEGIEKDSGKYFAGCALKNMPAKMYDEDMAVKLWDLSEKLVGLTQ